MRSYALFFVPLFLRGQDVPRWSAFICQEAKHFVYAYVDMARHFSERLAEAEMVLTTGV